MSTHFSKLSHKNLLFLKNTFRLGLRDFEAEASLNSKTSLNDNDNMLIDIADKVINEYQPNHNNRSSLSSRASTLGSSSSGKTSRTGKTPPKKKKNQPQAATMDAEHCSKLFKSVMRCIVSRWQNEVEHHLSHLMFKLLMKNNKEFRNCSTDYY